MNVVSAFVLATVLPESILGARWFAVLSTFVAINTILYVSISIFNVLPKLYLSDVVQRYGRRAETRSTYPKGHRAPDKGQRRGAMSVPDPGPDPGADRFMRGGGRGEAGPSIGCIADSFEYAPQNGSSIASEHPQGWGCKSRRDP